MRRKTSTGSFIELDQEKVNHYFVKLLKGSEKYSWTRLESYLKRYSELLLFEAVVVYINEEGRCVQIKNLKEALKDNPPKNIIKIVKIRIKYPERMMK